MSGSPEAASEGTLLAPRGRAKLKPAGVMPCCARGTRAHPLSLQNPGQRYSPRPGSACPFAGLLTVKSLFSNLRRPVRSSSTQAELSARPGAWPAVTLCLLPEEAPELGSQHPALHGCLLASFQKLPEQELTNGREVWTSRRERCTGADEQGAGETPTGLTSRASPEGAGGHSGRDTPEALGSGSTVARATQLIPCAQRSCIQSKCE